MEMTPLSLISIRAKIGDWVFYSGVMQLKDVAERVSFADAIHQNKQLSSLIQREIKTGRQNEIRDYLLKDTEHFFGSLIIAVYGGDPSWHGISIDKATENSLPSLPENPSSNLGVLSLSGSEKLFAVDGQHRLSGIKAAIPQSKELEAENVSVVFVGHKNTKSGLRRTRKPFRIGQRFDLLAIKKEQLNKFRGENPLNELLPIRCEINVLRSINEHVQFFTE